MVIGLLSVGIVYLFVRGAIAFTPANVRWFNLGVTTTKVLVPVLALFATIAWYRGWRQARKAMAEDDGVTEPLPPSLRPWAKKLLQTRLGLVWGAIMLVGGFSYDGFVNVDAHVQATSYVFDTADQSNCSWGTGRAAVCTYVLTNKAESTVTFNWTAESDPPGATFQPSSGTLAPGQSSSPITVTDPFICPIVFIFRDNDHHLERQFPFNDPCK
jgi:hypothetical protein